MAAYEVYLELGEGGACLAHVPALPGCMARAESREAALAALPGAIRAYHAWRRDHGEAAPDPPEPITLHVAATQEGMSLFERGGRAALFDPDRAPLSRAELERHLQIAAYTRADLLALVGSLPAAVLDWKEAAKAMSIREILRHVGNAEEWYVSRLVDPATLPPEWADDDRLPLRRFLAMERRTVAARLRRLTDDELARVHVPTARAHHPGEEWTARKALRRLLEHEQEHLGQIRAVLAAWRAHLLARLAAERAALWASVLHLDAVTLSTEPIMDGWTAKDLLAHVAAWDELFTERITLILDGRAAEMISVALDDRNAALYEERKDWSLEQAVAACDQARAAFLASLAWVSDAELHRTHDLPVGRRTIRAWLAWRWRHDRTHAGQIARRRKARKLPPTPGPKAILLAALAAARAELLALVALVPPAARDARPLCGAWTLKDVLGHVADWEWDIANEIYQVVDQVPQTVAEAAPVDDEADWNAAHAAARRGQSWSQVWLDFQAARQSLLEVLARLDDAAVTRPLPPPWSADDTLYGWVGVCLDHDREHAAGLRRELSAEQ
jgi:uncharacterized damage-inducible protein DinB/predicted RNase H-like HicB family nuclease